MLRRGGGLSQRWWKRAAAARHSAQFGSRPERKLCAEIARRSHRSVSRRVGGVEPMLTDLGSFAWRPLRLEDADAGHHLPHVYLARRLRRRAGPEPGESAGEARQG